MKSLHLSVLAPVLGLLLSIGTSACDDSSSASDETGGGPVCGEQWVEKPDLDTATDVMTEWGSPCETAADCSHLGADAECFLETIGVFELPGGVCSKRCTLPDSGTTVVLDADECDPAGGVACVGAKDIFSACMPPCSSDSECGREAYGCIRMPVISAPSDSTFCLMDPDACCLDPTMCT